MRGDARRRVDRLTPACRSWPTTEQIDAAVARLAVLLDEHPIPERLTDAEELRYLVRLLEPDH